MKNPTHKADPGKTVLLVDDDPHLLTPMVEYLSVDRDRYAVSTAYDAQKALEILSRHEIFLVVSDIKMPGMSGIELLSIIRNRYPHIDVILMTGFPTDEIRMQVERGGCLQLLEKPFDNESLRALINRQIRDQEEGFAGTLKNIQLNDLIQMCALSGISTVVQVAKGSHHGTIFIENGEIVHAVCEDIKGEQAFYQILCWQSGSFETLNTASFPHRTIEKNSQYLLMEAARMADETALETEHAPPAEEAGASEGPSKLRVLIVDDSYMMCRVLEEMLTSTPDISVVGTAKNGEEALHKIDSLKPDLITLDVNMPVMDGNTALKHIMIRNPCPVTIVSNMSSRTQSNAIDFLRLGAVDFLRKPTRDENMASQQRQFVEKIRLAASARINNFIRVKPPKLLPEKPEPLEKTPSPCGRLVVINSGAGGYAELIRLIPRLPRGMRACVLVLQAMPAEFVTPLSDYLNKRSPSDVLPLQTDAPLQGGRCYIGTSDTALKLRSMQGIHSLTEDSTSETAEKHNRFDHFLHSLADAAPVNTLIVLLSGAQVENLQELENIQAKNGRILIQQLSSCLVPGPLERVIASQVDGLEANPDEIVRQILHYGEGMRKDRVRIEH